MKLKSLFLFTPGCWMVVISSCHNGQGPVVISENKTDSSWHTKPPSTYADTLLIDQPAAVFYHPDPVQLKKIEAITEKATYESIIHENFYQMRNARMVLKKSWPAISIIEAKKVRFLLFKKNAADSILIDLDLKSDAYGLFLFKPPKEPQSADMMNIDTELTRYFSK